MTPASPSTTRHYILATAGHVDHGKSALVKALTGTDPDRLPEEKARGITIDLGFAGLPLPPDLSLGIIDVPGHEDFVKNMVAGVGSIDLALLVVAADDGWMPQTEEHLQILSYLGVEQGVVALTKTDLVPDPELVLTGIRDRLAGTPFAHAPVVPTSIMTGTGLDVLRQTLGASLANRDPSPDRGKPRLAVDRVFALRGIGTVVTGTLVGGSLNCGEPVVVQPSGRPARIRSIQSHNLDLPAASPGMRTALGLSDITRDTDVVRGSVVTRAELGPPARTLDVVLERSSRTAGSGLKSFRGAARPLRDETRVMVHLGSAAVAARVALAGRSVLAPGDRAIAQLRLESPAFVFCGDRFILRDAAEQATLAGGTVLGVGTARRGFHAAARLSALENQAADPFDLERAVLLELQRLGAARRDSLLVQSRFSAGQVGAALTRLGSTGEIILCGEVATPRVVWDAWLARAAAAVDQGHQEHPNEPGIPITELRDLTGIFSPPPGILDAFVERLAGHGFERAGAVIRRATHRVSLPLELTPFADRIRSILGNRPLDPPARKELGTAPAVARVIKYLVQTGEVVELNADLVMSGEAFTRARDLIVRYIEANGPATVSQLRQMLGTSRRILIPLLERLDRDGVTQRSGDVRSVRDRRPRPGV